MRLRPAWQGSARGSAHPIAGLLIVALALSACAPDPAKSSRRPGQVVTGADASAGRETLQVYGCTQCHIVPGIRDATGTVGPPLTGFSRRTFIAGRVPNTSEALITFIRDPQAIKPGSAMPRTGIGDQQARDVAAYLLTLE
jgi:cytochrome c